MSYLINVAEVMPARHGTAETRHFCEIRLATNSVVEATHILHTVHATWGIERKRGGSFVFKLVSVEERDMQSIVKVNE